MHESNGKAGRARTLLRVVLAVDGLMLFLTMCTASSNSGGLAWLMLLFLAGITSLALRYATKQGYWFVWRIERTWKQVCAGLGGNFVGEANDYLASIRAGFASRGKYYVPTQTKVAYPQLKSVRGHDQAWTAEVRFFDGQTIDDYNQHADAFALAFGVPFALDEDSGLIRVRAGQVPVPAAYDHPGQLETRQDDMHTRLLSPMVPEVPNVYAHAQAVPTLARELALLKAVPMARDLNGRVWHMPIGGQHVLIAARTGGGKGSFLWSLVLGLEPAWRVGLVKFWGCDPKRLELAIGSDCWEHYADNEADIVKMLEQCVQEMFERAGKLQGKVRKFTPSVDTPLNAVVVDELGYVSAMLPDKKLRERVEKAVSTILALGRAVGYSLVGAVQDPRKETVGFRDLFPIRIAGGLPEPMVDLVLGEGMHDAGAFCEQIPLTEPGVAYVISETTLKPVCVRSAWCDDLVIQRVLAAELARQALPAGDQVEDVPASQPNVWSTAPSMDE